MERYLCEAVMPSDTLRAKHLIEAVLDLATAHEFDDQARFGIHLSLEEALMNAIKHGNRNDVEKHVTLTCILAEGTIILKVTDEGPGFDPNDVPDCLAEENLDKPSGRGLELIRNFMSYVEWNDTGNEIEMRQVRTPVAA